MSKLNVKRQEKIEKGGKSAYPARVETLAVIVV